MRQYIGLIHKDAESDYGVFSGRRYVEKLGQ